MLRNPVDAPPRGVSLLLAGVLCVGGVLAAGLAGFGGTSRLEQAGSPSSAARPGDPATAAARISRTAELSQLQARAQVVQPLLAVRAAAVLTGRQSQWLKPLLPSAVRFRSAQAAAFVQIRRLPVRSFRYRLDGTSAVTPSRPSLGPDAFVARVDLAYRLAGDTRDVEREQYLTVARGPQGWALAGDGDGPTQKAVWDLGPLTVQSGARSLVIGLGQGTGIASLVRRTVQETDAAARQVDAVWGTRWPRTAVVLLPSTEQQMAVLLGRTGSGADSGTSGLDQIAAVTSGELSGCCGASGGVADRVVVNPVPFAALSPLGRHVVLTHELTHVATRASSPVAPPLWVEEGFANFVAYRGSGLSAAVIAGDLLPLLRAGTADQHLPSVTAFDPAFGPIAPAYADAWLAFRLIAGTNPARAVTFYRVAAGEAGSTQASAFAGATAGATDVAAQRDLATAFSSVLHQNQAEFERSWRTYRAHVLGTA